MLNDQHVSLYLSPPSTAIRDTDDGQKLIRKAHLSFHSGVTELISDKTRNFGKIPIPIRHFD